MYPILHHVNLMQIWNLLNNNLNPKNCGNRLNSLRSTDHSPGRTQSFLMWSDTYTYLSTIWRADGPRPLIVKFPSSLKAWMKTPHMCITCTLLLLNSATCLLPAMSNLTSTSDQLYFRYLRMTVLVGESLLTPADRGFLLKSPILVLCCSILSFVSSLEVVCVWVTMICSRSWPYECFCALSSWKTRMGMVRKMGIWGP